MRLKTVQTIYLKELRDVLRDRRTIVVMLVLPVLLYPLLIIGFSMLTAVQISRIESKDSRIVVLGDLSGYGSQLLDTLQGVAQEDSAGWEQRIRAGELDATVRFAPGFTDSIDTGNSGIAEIFYNSSREVSHEAANRLSSALDNLNDRVVVQRLESLSADTSLLSPIRISKANLASEEQKQGAYLGKMLGYLLIIMSLMGAFYPAIDLTAGEKERGTLETLLVSPAGRTEIVYGKFLAVGTIALITACLNVLSLGMSLIYVTGLFAKSVGGGLGQFAVEPASLVLALLLIIPLIVLFGAICLAVAVSARSYKEGQSLLTPLYSLVILPAMFSLVPGIEMSPKLALVPIVNVSLLIKEYMTGNYLWLETLIAFGSTSILALLALSWCVNQFNQESVLFRHSEAMRWSPFRMKRKPGMHGRLIPEPGAAILLLAVELIVLFGASLKLSDLNPIRVILTSQGLILLPVILLFYRGGYDVRRTLQLYAPKSHAWPATLLAILGGWVLSIELATAQNFWMPFPEEFIEQFLKLFESLNSLPLVASLLLIAVLPGVLEEVLCRGIVLRSLLPRFGPAGAIVMTGVAFGLLHLDPYRLLPTTFLGILLGYIAWSTGSIFPSMFAHATNNALSFLVQKFGDRLPEFAWLQSETIDFLPWYIVVAGVVIMLTGILWLSASPASDSGRRQESAVGP